MTPQQCIEEFERRQATKDFAAVADLLTPDALFFFNDGSFRGHEQIRKAFEDTWAYNPEEERYTLHDVRWLAEGADVAACTYGFVWEGVVKGRAFRSLGRGTAVLRRDGERWRIAHEHLSADPAAS